MDKVKAILKHKFWLLFLFLLPVLCYGYFSASAAIKPAIEQRSTALKTVSDSVDKSFAANPNETYKVGLEGFANQIEAANVNVRRDVWETQLKDMTWPGVIANLMEKDDLRGYRAVELTTDKTLVTLRRKYADTYEKQILELFKRFEPFVGEKFNGRDVDWPQKVLVSQKAIPVPPIKTGSNITGERMWDAQEDIWLVDVIADLIRDMNEEAEGISQAAIRKIDKFQLLGGTGEPSFEDSGAAAAAFGGGSGYGADEYGSDYGGGGEFGPTGAVGGKTKVDFDPASEFGSAGLSAVGDYSDYESAFASDPSGLGAASAPVERYIGEVEEGAPFKERGFYLSLLIEQDRVDEFLSQLSSARWPIRISRFHIGPNPYFKEVVKKSPTAGYPGGGYPGGGGGYPGGGGGYPGGGYPGGGGYPDGDYSGEGYEDGGYPGDEYGGGGGEFGVTAGNAAAISDPVAATAIASSELIHLAIAGAITMYTQPDVDIIGEPSTYPVPVQGQPYKIPDPESDTSDAVAMVNRDEIDSTEADAGTDDANTTSDQ